MTEANDPYLVRITAYHSDETGLGNYTPVTLDVENNGTALLLAHICSAILYDLSVTHSFPQQMHKALETPSTYFESSFLTGNTGL